MVKSFGNAAVKASAPHGLTAHTRSLRVAALIHEMRDNSVEYKLVIVVHIRKTDKVLNTLGRCLGEKLYLYLAVVLYGHYSDLLALLGRDKVQYLSSLGSVFSRRCAFGSCVGIISGIICTAGCH